MDTLFLFYSVKVHAPHQAIGYRHICCCGSKLQVVANNGQIGWLTVNTDLVYWLIWPVTLKKSITVDTFYWFDMAVYNRLLDWESKAGKKG